jgi:hypothetical protein
VSDLAGTEDATAAAHDVMAGDAGGFIDDDKTGVGHKFLLRLKTRAFDLAQKRTSKAAGVWIRMSV